MNPANAATIVRILLIPFFVYSLLRGWNPAALGIFFAAVVTDFLDGYFARTYKSGTKLGSYLDPAADKLLVSSSLVTLTYLGGIPLWLTILVFSRDLLVSLGTGLVVLIKGALEIRPTLAGKASVFFQLVLVLTVLMSRDPFAGWLNRLVKPGVLKEMIFQLSIGTAFFTLVSCAQYLYRGGAEVLGEGE